MSRPHPVIGLLRAGTLLSLGWVAAAALAAVVYDALWAAPLLLVWILLFRHFHRALEALARALPGGTEPRA